MNEEAGGTHLNNMKISISNRIRRVFMNTGREEVAQHNATPQLTGFRKVIKRKTSGCKAISTLNHKPL